MFRVVNFELDQLKLIIQLYGKFLKLDEERKRRIREPESFIGRIKRSKVESEVAFMTFDVVDLHRRSTVPPGCPLPSHRTVVVLTTWSSEEGIPTRFQPLDLKCLKSKHSLL